MGGACSSSKDNDFYKQEQFVKRNFNKYNDRLGKKYSREQIESKLRTLYYNSDKK